MTFVHLNWFLCLLIPFFWISGSGAQSSAVISLDGSDWIWVGNVNGSVLRFNGNVPGDVYSDLHHGGNVPDLLFERSDLTLRWVGRTNWTLMKVFQLKLDELKGKRVELQLTGVDTIADVQFNGAVILRAENMFRQFTVDITSRLQAANWLAIEFTSPVMYANYSRQHFKQVLPECWPDEFHAECHINFLRKMQASFGWDWGPAFATMGIWGSAELLVRNFPTINYVKFYPQMHDNNGTIWSADVGVILHADDLDMVTNQLCFAVTIPKLVDTPIMKCFPSTNLLGEFKFTVVTKSTQVQPWWCNNMGDPHLYTLQVDLMIDKTLVSTKTVSVGFKVIQVHEDKMPDGGNSFYISLNGIPVFMRGANLIPTTLFRSDQTVDRYKYLLTVAKEVGMNMIRVWGGGNYESDTFYGLCDELGILIWQDAIFACSAYPIDNNIAVNVQEEIYHNVNRMQYHASLGLWSANNEIETLLASGGFNIPSMSPEYVADYILLFRGVIQKGIQANDPTRPFVLSSPSNGKISLQDGVNKDPDNPLYGDVHYYRYSGPIWDEKSFLIGRFVSEFGFQSYPSLETWQTATGNQTEWSISSPLMVFRQHHPDGQPQIMDIASNYLGAPPLCHSNDKAIEYHLSSYWSQINQAMIYKAYSHALRRHQCQSINSMGAIYWQLNDVWQAPSWSSIEINGKWKMLHYFARRFYLERRLMAVLDSDSDDVVVHYTFSQMANQMKVSLNVSMSITCLSASSFNPLASPMEITNSFSVSCPVVMVFNDTATNLMQRCGCTSRTDCLVQFQLLEGGPVPDVMDKDLASDWLLLEKPKNLKFMSAEANAITLKPEMISPGEFKVTISTVKPALFAYVDARGVRGWFSDNGMPLMKNNTEIAFKMYEEPYPSLQEFSSSLSVVHLGSLVCP